MKPRGAPTSAFLQEAARRAEEEKEAAKVDPWESEGEEEEKNDAVLEDEEDSLRGERMHAWVSPPQPAFSTGQTNVCDILFACVSTVRWGWGQGMVPGSGGDSIARLSARSTGGEETLVPGTHSEKLSFFRYCQKIQHQLDCQDREVHGISLFFVVVMNQVLRSNT